MSQTGYTPIQLYYSTTASTAPTAGNLASGELAINITDGKLFYKDNAGVVQTLATKAATSGTYTSITLSGGTANGVAYLNGSKVVTTGSALTFDGTNFTNSQSTASPIGFKLNNANASTSAGTRLTFQYNGGDTGYIGNQFDGSDFNNQYAANRFHIWLNGGSEQMRLTSTGLGIGTSSPAYPLDVRRGASTNAYGIFAGGGRADTAAMLYGQGSNGVGYVYNFENAAIVFGTANTERMRLDSSGNLGLGVTPSAWSTSYKAYQVGYGSLWTATSSPTFVSVSANSFYSSGGYAYSTTGVASDYYQNAGSHVWRTAASGTAGNAITFTQAMTLDASGNLGIGTTSPAISGYLIANIKGGASTAPALSLDATSTGTSGRQFIILTSGSPNNGLIFYDQTAAAERARIDSSGNLLVGVTSDTNTPTVGVTIRNTATTVGNLGIGHATGTASGNPYATFAYNGSGIGSVTQSGTTGVLYNITSDYRLKEVIGAVSGSGERIDALQPIDYTMKSDGSRTRGFLAHKFQEVYPNSVSGEKDAVDADGKPIYQQMQAGTAEVIADLVAEIQSLRARLKAANIA